MVENEPLIGKPDNEPILGRYGKYVEITDLTEISNATTIHKAIIDDVDSNYSSIGHTHTKSDITDFNHTHTKSDITDFSHTHTESDITISDTGWIDFPFNANADHYSNTGRIRLRKYGKMVVITGLGKSNRNISANSDLEIGTLTTDYTPSVDVYGGWSGAYYSTTSQKSGHIRIKTDGTVILSLRSGSSVTMNSGDYFAFNITYIV